MNGEVRLETLLEKMSPELIEGDFVFCTIKDGSYGDHASCHPIAAFREQEGLTLVMQREKAETAGLRFEGVFRCISLGVHSSLEAVGLTSAIAGILSEHDIPANVIAAYYHDHFFIPAELAQHAIGILSVYNEN